MAPDEIARAMRQGIEPVGTAALFGARVALIECLIHQEDIRRPLNLPRTIRANAVRECLNFARASPVIGAARRTRGIRFVATDGDWAAGHGQEVHGASDALLLAMTGRADGVADELRGEGLGRLLGR